MARSSDLERAADVPTVEREQYEESAAAKAAETVDPPAPEATPQRLEDAAANNAAAQEEDAPLTHVLTLDENFPFPDGPVSEVRVAFPGSAQVEGADEHGRITLSPGAEVRVTAEVANNAEGGAVKVAPIEDNS
jgi:hypothetical protein